MQYLNARPLIHGFPGPITFRHPSALAPMMREGRLDVALVPVFEALGSPRCPIADGVAIASAGEVFSVFLATRGPLRDVSRVVLDPASLTSAHLVRCILGEFHGIEPEYAADRAGETDALLLIGNQAIEFRGREGAAWEYHDLGSEWKRHTGLPFVFAAWMIGEKVPDPAVVADELRALKTFGVARVDEICATQPPGHRDFCREYLTRYIRFDLGAREKAGLRLFRELLAKRRHLEPSDVPLRFV